MTLLTDFSKNETLAWQSRWLPFVQVNRQRLADINVEHPVVHTAILPKPHYKALAFGAWLGVLRQTDYTSISHAEQVIRALLQLAQDDPHEQRTTGVYSATQP